MAKTVRYYIDVDESGAIRGGKNVQDQFAKIDASADQTGVKSVALGNIMADVVMNMASKLADLPGQLFDVGTNVEETASKYNTVFGPSVDYVNEFLDEFAVKAGLSNSAAQELTARAGAIGQGFGFTQAESAKLSTEIAKLSGDLTSFNNVPIEQSSNAVISALSGEREALKTLGIVINETDVQKEALAATGKESADQLTQQEKATATLALITERAGVAVGDLDRTQDSAANTSRRVQAQLANIGEELSTKFLPLMADGLAFVEQILSSDEFETFSDGMYEVIDNIVLGIEFLTQNTEAGVEAMFAVWQWLKDNIATVFINMVTVAKNYITSLPEIFWNGVVAIFKVFDSLVEYSFESIGNIIEGFWELGKAILAAITDPLNAKAEIEAAFGNLLQIGKDQLGNVANLGKELGATLKENFTDNAELLADGLIEYDNSAFTGVEFTTWSEASKKKIQEGLKTTIPAPDVPEVDFSGGPEHEIPLPEFGALPEYDFSKVLKISDGTLNTLNDQLATIDLMPDKSINDLQEKLNVVKELHSAAQTDAERERLALAEQGIQRQLQARQTGITEEQILLEEHYEIVSEQLNEVFNGAMNLYANFASLQAANTEAELSRIDKEKKKRLKSIDAQLKNEKLSEKQKEELVEKRKKIEFQYDQQSNSIKKEQYEKEKRANTYIAIAETAIAVAEALPNIPLSIAAGIAGALQVAVIRSQPNPYFAGGPVLERMPEGMTTPGKKIISINETSVPEYVVNGMSTQQFMPVLDLINYQPDVAEQVLMPMFEAPSVSSMFEQNVLQQDFSTPERFAFGGLTDSSAPFASPVINSFAERDLEIPVIETINSEQISDAIAAGFENLKANFKLVAEGTELRAVQDETASFEGRQIVSF